LSLAVLQLLGEGVGVGDGLEGPGEGVGVGVGVGFGLEGLGEGLGEGEGDGLGVAPCDGRQFPDLKSERETPSSAAFSLRSATDMPAEMFALSALVLLISSYHSYSHHDNQC
jgi:hypothetical protein